jgi:hypothetical protein
MKAKFTHKIAKEIAKNQFNWTLDCVIGRQDPDYGFETEKWEFEQNFEEELEQLNLCSCQEHLDIIYNYYKKLVDKVILKLEKMYVK